MLRLIKEDTIKPISIDQVEETVPESIIEEVPVSVIANACQDVVNNLIQAAWNFISEVNSTIATLEYDFKDEAAKKEIIELLNTIVDDSTINIGVLHKVFELVNTDTANLLASGTEKAENIIDTDNTEIEPETENSADN